jgi:hypothetical protein
MKSFRAAAERIVRQETASPTDILRLLGSAVEPAPTIATEQDAWDARLAALAQVGEYDALAITASRPLQLAQWHNISEPRELQDAVADASAEAARRGAAVQVRAPIVLADGRIASEVMVAPLTALQGVEGVLIALRVGRGFSAADAGTGASVGTILALEAARAETVRTDTRTVHQSLALFELARLGLGSEEIGERLVVMVEVVARSLGHDVAQLWLLRGGGSLRRRAAHPRESLVLEIARPRDHAGLARALDGETFQGTDPSLRSWIRRSTRDLIIAPLRGSRGVSGLLAVGRFSEGYGSDDLRMATQCADFFAKIVEADALARSSQANGAREDARASEDGLTGS